MILCAGEALIDMISEPTSSGTTGFVPHCGGAIFNTAIALGRLGIPVGLMTGLSRDMFGQQLQGHLAQSGVDTAQCIASDRPTTLAFVQLVDGQARYSFFDENSAGRMLQPEDLPALSETTTTLYCGGISLASRPGAETYAGLIEREAEARVVMLDPNIRPGFIQDEETYRVRISRLVRKADIIKVSDEDLAWIDGRAVSLHNKAHTLLEQGPSLVIITEGRKGATAFLATGDSIHHPAETVEVVDTVGAGDTFNAGLMANFQKQALLHKETIRSLTSDQVKEAMAFGARIAGITVSRSGANPPWAHELDL